MKARSGAFSIIMTKRLTITKREFEKLQAHNRELVREAYNRHKERIAAGTAQLGTREQPATTRTRLNFALEELQQEAS